MDIHNIKTFLIEHGYAAQILLFATVIISLWLAENLASTETTGQKWQHTSVNALFILSALPIQLVFAFVLTAQANWDAAHHWGIIHLFPNPSNPWIKYVFAFFLLDFLDYVYHVAMHKVKGLWRFHLVHHTDLKVDVSSNLREHPGETLIRNCFLVVWVFICGASFGVLFLRQAVQTFANISSHTSLDLPPRSARVLGWIFVTPNFHKVHHHYQRPYTDCNYGDVFSVWDRIFGTFAELSAKDTLLGLDTHMDEAINSKFLGLMAMPFRRPEPTIQIDPRSTRWRWQLAFLTILGVLFTAVPAQAWGQDYSYKIVHPTYGDIGIFTENITKSANDTQIDIRVRIAVKILGFTVYREEGDRHETFHGNRFVSLKSFTITNGTRIDVTGEARGNHFFITSSAGVDEAPATIFPSDPWMVRDRGVGTSVAIETGEILTTHITGGEPVLLSLQGVTVDTRHFTANGEDQHYEVWLNDRDVPVMFRSVEDDTPIDFILTSSLHDAALTEAHLVPRATLRAESKKNYVSWEKGAE